ncbi:MAG TPA: hypothetical protein VGL06_23935 [Pseudonocardiaceae bacterium]
MLSVPRPSSTAGLHHTDVPVQRGALRVLLTVCARRLRRLVNPRYLPLLENDPDRCAAIHATRSGALWTVVGLLAAVLLVITAIAMSVRAGRLTYRRKPLRTPLGE